MKVLVLFALALACVFAQACEDQSEYCADWKASGWCVEYKDHLKESCAKTCGFCGGNGGGGGGENNEVAEDPRPAREPKKPDFCTDACATGACEWYKGADHCKKYSAVMVENCARTCGWCGARTCTPPNVANGWTDFENTLAPSGAVVNVYCYEGFKSYGSSQLTCNSYGEFDGSASCVAVDGDSGSLSQQTECQRAAESAVSEGFKDGQYVVPQASTHYIPQCDYEGNYKEIQYDGGSGSTFCVDRYRGIEIEGTRISGKHEYIGCTRDSAKEYYARIAAESGQASSSSSDQYGGSDGYDYYPAPVEPAYDQYASADSGDSWYDGGDAWSDGGDSWAVAEDSGESWSDGGDSWSDGGDSWSDGGDSWSDGGDSWYDGGDSWSNSDSGFDSGSYYEEPAPAGGDDYGNYETRYYDAGADTGDAAAGADEVSGEVSGDTSGEAESSGGTVYYSDTGAADEAIAVKSDIDIVEADDGLGLRWKRDTEDTQAGDLLNLKR